jgi:hypothetical protein
MIETPIHLAGAALTADIEQRAEQVCIDAGLHIALKTTLASYPGCVHWHWKQGSAPGILELTWWSQQRRLWFAIHENRKAAWIDRLMASLPARLAAVINTQPSL